jgi:uroporphyrinogen decarboxylase
MRETEMKIRKLKIKPDPDFSRLEKVLRRQGTPDRVPFFELFSNIESEVMAAIGKKENNGLQQHINYYYYLGYDYVNIGAKNFGFPTEERPKTETVQGERAYITAGSQTISNREDFEKYPWPVICDVDYSPLEKVIKFIPQGMKVISGGAGILENVMWLLGYEGISLLLYDDPQLVEDMFEAVATRIIKHYDNLASYEVVGALQLGEDMGFKTQTMLSPEIYRKYLFPWHRKLVDTVHKHGKLTIIHACGNLKEVMDDIINCGWDAKQSFEDVIKPVWEVKKEYGDRIALLGGFDMDKISRMSEDEVRAYTRFLIDKCAPGGGWALGTGNTVANYIPVNNFLAMLEEGFRYKNV